MLDYQWGNPSPTVLTPDPTTLDSTRPIYHHHHHPYYAHTAAYSFNVVEPQFSTIQTNPIPDFQFHTFPELNPYKIGPISNYNTGGLTLEPAGYTVVPKAEPGYEFMNGGGGGIGLNLGGRTYFASEGDLVNRVYLRSRGIIEPGLLNLPRCQVEGCGTDLSHAKHYHRRHKVCEFHSKAATVVAAGLTQRFCQQCSRFHLLSEFDNGKRSCRRRLADHNRRRRKSNQSNQDSIKSQIINHNVNPAETLQRLPPTSSSYSSYITGGGSATTATSSASSPFY